MTVNVKRLQFTLGKSKLALPEQVVKRDGSTTGFDIRRIETAIEKCYKSLPNEPGTPADKVIEGVASAIAYRYGADKIPTVEQVQDLVEVSLVSAGEYEAAKHYILYRNEHAKARRERVPDEVKATFDADKKFFPTLLQQFQFYDKYSRFNWTHMRRETWIETVDRTVNHLRWLVRDYHGGDLPDAVFERIRSYILDMKSMPSMRMLAMAGEAAQRNGMAIYNCSYLPVRDTDAFVEALLISMAGCGVGFSVERQYVEEFPRIARQTGEKTLHVIEDTTEGWAESLRFGLNEWFAGRDVEYVYDGIRPAGTVLKVKGGRASGPEPLRFLLNFARETVLSRQGSFLRTTDAHSIMCVVGGAAVSGGVRRTAMISLFSWDDVEMRDIKNRPNFPDYLWNANNSAVWPDEITQREVIEVMTEMDRGRRGEPGLFSRANALRTLPPRRLPAEFGTNPCGEINLRPYGLCNLTIAVARAEDSVADLLEKVEVATIIGTIQSLSTNFVGMRPEWKANCEDERLLGVDITGQQDCAAIQSASVQALLKKHAIAINEKYAKLLGINPSASITCNKPSGNSSQLLDCSSGIHTRWAPYYLRRTRVSALTALYRVLKDAGVPMTPENGQTVDNATTWVVAWPVRAPEGAVTRKDRSAVEQANYWKLCKESWTEHNPSVTITYQPNELLPITSWVWDNRNIIGGMTFLPADDHDYQQAPYEEISADDYLRAVEAFPSDIDFSKLFAYEHTDMTTAAQELACLAGNCDV